MNVYQAIIDCLLPGCQSADCTFLDSLLNLSHMFCAVLFLGLSIALNAQQSEEKVTKLKEMVITATKREYPLQAAPLSALDVQMFNNLEFSDSGYQGSNIIQGFTLV